MQLDNGVGMCISRVLVGRPWLLSHRLRRRHYPPVGGGSAADWPPQRAGPSDAHATCAQTVATRQLRAAEAVTASRQCMLSLPRKWSLLNGTATCSTIPRDGAYRTHVLPETVLWSINKLRTMTAGRARDATTCWRCRFRPGMAFCP